MPAGAESNGHAGILAGNRGGRSRVRASVKSSVRLLLPLMLAAVLLAACAGAGAPGKQIEHPIDDAVILRISYSGGFVGPGFDLLNHPTFSLLGDGRVIVPGAQDLIFPGPALPAMNVRRLTESGIQAVLAELEATGLFAEDLDLRGAQNCVADASDVIFAMHADQRDVTVTVYGLGILDGGSSCSGVSADELAMHVTLNRLTGSLSDLDSWLPVGSWSDEWQTFRPQAMRLVVRNADADEPDGSGIPSSLVPWPAGSDPATFGETTDFGLRCGVVAGTEADEWYDLLGAANQLTRFTRDDHRYAVSVRFLLPDEPPLCIAQVV